MVVHSCVCHELCSNKISTSHATSVSQVTRRHCPLESPAERAPKSLYNRPAPHREEMSHNFLQPHAPGPSTRPDTRSNRVTMKMEVSYSNHSHIIGEGGMSIRRVMEETNCFVHFPDSKQQSNQVSISGDIQGVELARSRIRQKTPVIFGFELPIMSQIVDPLGRYIVEIQEQYGVHVVHSNRQHATLLQVKGVEWEIEQAKKATTLLVEYVYEFSANQIPIQMTMEISPIHHAMVIGKNHQNIKEIMQLTDTQILFANADDNIPISEKNILTIFGSTNNVYAARQSLTGSLPLLLFFDLPGNPNYKSEKLMDVQTKYDVHIRVEDKFYSNPMLCMIKGHERNATNIYNIYNMLVI